MERDTPLMVVDSDGVVIQWSRRAAELLGRAAPEVVGRPATHLVTRAAAKPGSRTESDPDEVALYDVDGRSVEADLRVRPLLRRDGSVAWAVFRVRAAETASPGMGTAALQALFASAPAGLFVLDGQLRIVSASSATRTLCGVDPERILGRRLTDVYGLSDPGEVEAMLRGVLDSGTPSPERVMRVHSEAAHGRECLVSVSAFRRQDPQGAVVAMVDVTEREKTRAGLRVLHVVRERVGRTLDVVATCQELVDALVPGFADIAVVEVVDAVVRGEEPPLAPLGRGVPLRRAAFRRSGGEQGAYAHPVGDVRSLPFPTPYAQALADLKPRVVALGPETPWLAADPARAEAIGASDARTLIAAPLALHGTVLGLVSLYRTRQIDSYDETDVAIALEVAAHTALCIDNARRYAREHTIAATVQRHLLPPLLPTQTAVETAHLHVPGASGGGGWFDTFALPGARTALVVGDIKGHGIHAATTMGQLRTVMRSLAALDLEPDELLARLNDAATLLARERAALPPSDPLYQKALSASCVYAVYDPLTRRCTVARAGHPAPVIAGPDGTTEIADLPDGPLLGSAEGPPFAADALPLADGSVLAFYTPFLLPTSTAGPAPLRRVLADPNRPLQDLRDEAVYLLRGDTPRLGDAVLLLARTHNFPTDHVATWHLDHDPTAPATARTHAQRQLTTWGVGEDIVYATQLIVSELVTNAVRYGTPPLRLRIIHDRTHTCEVHDTSPIAPRLRHARTIDEGGRGLFIVAQLAGNWGVRYTPDGKNVWTEQALPAQPW